MNELVTCCYECKTPMFYKNYCPKCETPKLEIVFQYNLLQCLYYIESLGHKNFKDNFWSKFSTIYDLSDGSVIELVCRDDTDPLIKEIFKNIHPEDNKMKFYVLL